MSVVRRPARQRLDDPDLLLAAPQQAEPGIARLRARDRDADPDLAAPPRARDGSVVTSPGGVVSSAGAEAVSRAPRGRRVGTSVHSSRGSPAGPSESTGDARPAARATRSRCRGSPGPAGDPGGRGDRRRAAPPCHTTAARPSSPATASSMREHRVRSRPRGQRARSRRRAERRPRAARRPVGDERRRARAWRRRRPPRRPRSAPPRASRPGGSGDRQRRAVEHGLDAVARRPGDQGMAGGRDGDVGLRPRPARRRAGGGRSASVPAGDHVVPVERATRSAVVPGEDVLAHPHGRRAARGVDADPRRRIEVRARGPASSLRLVPSGANTRARTPLATVNQTTAAQPPGATATRRITSGEARRASPAAPNVAAGAPDDRSAPDGPGACPRRPPPSRRRAAATTGHSSSPGTQLARSRPSPRPPPARARARRARPRCTPRSPRAGPRARTRRPAPPPAAPASTSTLRIARVIRRTVAVKPRTGRPME